LGISEDTGWIVVIVLTAAFLGYIFISYISGEGPYGFAYKLFRALWYDMMYFFGGPRFAEV